MKKIIFILLTLSFSLSYSQHCLKTNTYFPIRSFAYLSNPSFGLDYNYLITDKYDGFTVKVTIGFVKYNITSEPL